MTTPQKMLKEGLRSIYVTCQTESLAQAIWKLKCVGYLNMKMQGVIYSVTGIHLPVFSNVAFLLQFKIKSIKHSPFLWQQSESCYQYR